MGTNVLPSEVGTIFLVSISIAIENQAILLTIRAGSVSASAKKYAQLQRHVETGKSICRIKRSARNVVYAIPTFPNYVVQLFHANLATVARLQRATRLKAAVMDSEYQRPKKSSVPNIKRDV